MLYIFIKPVMENILGTNNDTIEDNNIGDKSKAENLTLSENSLDPKTSPQLSL